MKALFLKDLYTLRESRTLIVLMFALAAIISIGQGAESTGFVISYITVLSAVLVLNSINYDELDNGYAFLLTLPVMRKQYVVEKYLFGLFTGIGAWFIAAALETIVLGLPAAGDTWWMLYVGALVFMLFMQALMIPVQLKLGGQKGKVAMLILFAAVFGAAAALVKSTGTENPIWNEWISLNLPFLSIFAVAAAAACLAVSFLCSLHIMEKKEF